MKLEKYFRIVRTRGWIVVVLAVLVAGAAVVYSKRMEPIFQASITVAIRPARPDWGLGQALGGLLRSMAGDITTHQFLGEIIDRGQFDTTTSDLLYAKKLFVKDEASDFTITITVRDPSPDVAIQMVNLIAAYFKEQRDQWNDKQNKSDRIDIEIRDWARDASLYSPNTKINTAAGGVAGGLVGLVIVVVLEWLQSSTIRSLEDIDRLGVPALGTIPVQSRRRK